MSLLTEITRMRELAGIKNASEFVVSEEFLTRQEILSQEEPENYKKPEDIVGEINREEQEDILSNINKDVDSAEEISDNAENLYPGTRYYGMYTGQDMAEAKISDLEDDSDLLIEDKILI